MNNTKEAIFLQYFFKIILDRKSTDYVITVQNFPHAFIIWTKMVLSLKTTSSPLPFTSLGASTRNTTGTTVLHFTKQSLLQDQIDTPTLNTVPLRSPLHHKLTSLDNKIYWKFYTLWTRNNTPNIWDYNGIHTTHKSWEVSKKQEPLAGSLVFTKVLINWSFSFLFQ